MWESFIYVTVCLMCRSTKEAGLFPVWYTEAIEAKEEAEGVNGKVGRNLGKRSECDIKAVG